MMSIRSDNASRPGNDEYQAAYPTGPYATFDNYFGIRRTPYSTDFDITGLKSLHPNRTTSEEVRKRLGDPSGYDVTYVGDHRYQTWVYSVARLENAERPIVKQANLHFQNGILMWFELQGEGFVLD